MCPKKKKKIGRTNSLHTRRDKKKKDDANSLSQNISYFINIQIRFPKPFCYREASANDTKLLC